jgi:tRNA threonylcarbamoyl adenosine modification protein (Sua5/YciO/YrdC/YwlC family)
MAQYFTIHPENPQQRLINQVVDIVHKGGVIAYPTDSVYALACHIGDKQAVDRIRSIRQLNKDHNFTLICRDLSELATFARVDNIVFRTLKAATPGPYTFILKASTEVPKRLVHPKRKTIGIRVPDSSIVKALLDTLHEPIMSVTMIMPEQTYPLTDPYEINQLIGSQIDAVVDGGSCGLEPTTVVDMTTDEIQILREGAGDSSIISG